MSICLLILVIYNFPLLFSLTVYLLNLGIWPGEFSITWTLLIAYSRGSSTLSFVLWMSSKLLARYRGLLWLRFYLFDKTIRNRVLFCQEVHGLRLSLLCWNYISPYLSEAHSSDFSLRAHGNNIIVESRLCPLYLKVSFSRYKVLDSHILSMTRSTS